MRSTNIRSESRLHVVKVDDLEAPQVSQLLGRVCFALRRDGMRGSIIDAYLTSRAVDKDSHEAAHHDPAADGQPVDKDSREADRASR